MSSEGNVVDFASAGAKGMSQQPNITELSDEEIREVADKYWLHLIRASNDGNYGEFARYLSREFAMAMNMVAFNHQYHNSELARTLSEDFDFLGIIRRGEHVTVLYRQRSTAKEGEWVGRLVLGYEDGQIRIFGASFF